MNHPNGRNGALLAWYRVSGRALPWRDTDDPWAILVSEVMAQQTQVSRVVPAYHAFLDRFPHPAALARATLAEVITVWGDLGYQRRAVNLQRAAGVIADQGWPRTRDELIRLPGVGPYTAAAVACFAFGEVVPAVDTNLRRVLRRWVGERLSDAAVTETASELIDPVSPGDWNQAVMDLAATVCHPRSPDCGACPVTEWCADPTIVTAGSRQPRYEGSVRQARAALVKLLATELAIARVELATRVGLDPQVVDRAVAGLAAEELVTVDSGRISLAG